MENQAKIKRLGKSASIFSFNDYKIISSSYCYPYKLPNFKFLWDHRTLEMSKINLGEGTHKIMKESKDLIK